SRDILRLGEDQVFPRMFAKVSPRHRVPYPGVILVTILVVLALLLNLDIEQYSMLTVFAFLLLQCISAVAVFRIKKLNVDLWNAAPIKYNKFWIATTLIGLIVTSVMIFVFAAISEPITMVVFIGVLIVGYLIWALRSSIVKRR